ncbi:FAD-binding domain-containing protein [Marinobacter sp. NSM]|uniref:FAD-binding domain-containing protein n=1 Tax=Marinobacter sp. NSM TaxID=3458004 RepID=UPI004035621A
MQVFWLKRNLRLQDSDPFYFSMAGVRSHGPVLPVYVHEPNLICQPDVSRQHQVFVQETLAELSVEIERLGGRLLELVGESLDVFKQLHRITPITRIWTHRETTQNSQYERDKQMKAWCQAAGIELMECQQNGIARGEQTSLSFPDYFAQCVTRKLKDPTGTSLTNRFAKPPLPAASPESIPVATGDDKPFRQRGGRTLAVNAMRSFFSIRSLQRYPFQISSPNTAWNGCSRLSTYLAYGIISDREVFQAVDGVVTQGHEKLSPESFQKLQERARFYLDRLMWRRQYIQTFEHHPELEFQHMLPQFDGVRESEFDQERFEAWKVGRTGVPYIDAAMRCLRQTGWINMRLRATVVSFATMNLWLPTLQVARHLAGEFLDYEPAVHYPIHHVVSGTSSFDNLMVYDPIKQGIDNDSAGVFIRRWVPELRALKGADVHDITRTVGCLSDEACDLGLLPYPAPIVDYRQAGKLAKQRVSDLRKGKSVPAGVSEADAGTQLSLM